jgi:hypothetical protein
MTDMCEANPASSAVLGLTLAALLLWFVFGLLRAAGSYVERKILGAPTNRGPDLSFLPFCIYSLAFTLLVRNFSTLPRRSP